MVRPEYPRPHFDRSSAWQSLNAEWEFRPDPAETGSPADGEPWRQTITVPFAWETPASGIEAHWLTTGWYRRAIEVPADWAGQRVILHFGAVSHEAIVWLNGIEVARHVGAYLPFEADITDALRDGKGTLLVRAHNPIDKRFIPHGKQRSIPRDDFDGVCFAPTSGIWQPVWLEPRPATWLDTLDLRPNRGLDGIHVTLSAKGPRAAKAVAEIALAESEPVHVTLDGSGSARVLLPISRPRLWSPEDPHLYLVEATLATADGVDRVRSYTGLRAIEILGEEIRLNGRRIFLRGVLDQGYWPGSGMTAGDDSELVRDIELARRAGFNLVRKHIKLEDPRWLYHADRLGMLVWAELPGAGRFTPESVSAFEAQIEPMVARDGNHPAIVIWGLYNEEWGLDWDIVGDPAKQDAARRAYHMLKAIDPERPVVENSGWTHVKTDILDWHVYDEDVASWAETVAALMSGRRDGFPVKLGPNFVVEKKLAAVPDQPLRGLPNMNSEYGGGFTSVERGWHLRWQTQELRRHDRLGGYIYTELYDIQHEMAGLLFFDRSEKDLGGAEPSAVNAETVFVFDITPVAPGRDIVSADGRLTVPTRISHHGSGPAIGCVRAWWGPHMGRQTDLPTETATSFAAGEVRAQPFVLSDSIAIEVELPPGQDSARLHLTFEIGGERLAYGFLDVTR